MTPRELLAHRNGTAANGPGWRLRVVPNQFPVLRVEGTLDRQGEGLFDKMNGIGAHEVIIETPRHEDTLATMSDAAIEDVLWAFRERVQDLKRDQRFRYIIVFKNHGAAAGAALDHSHSQIIALPIVPREVRDEVDGARAHYQGKERCVFCDIVRQELGGWQARDPGERRHGGDGAVRAAFSRSRPGSCRGGTSHTSRTRRATSTHRWRGCSVTCCAGSTRRCGTRPTTC